MAQGDEETEIQVTDTLTLCVNNCGFYGNPATDNMCQSCFNATEPTPTPPRPMIPPSTRSVGLRPADDQIHSKPAPSKVTSLETNPCPTRALNRCSGCWRKVGLTGFRCRCGELFCGEHRYSDRHDCSFDYKTAGRAAISRDNPVVRASKIVRL
ncbi:hypothetical protein HPP92_015249 [Vanilla planifolia]|uniref:Uncharacterized protein n=1 Tax=Vanilla planifolia TaxID=51239 RepID=A0A835QW35_VANPL|nr:hypothetical protein HPP92_015249 [Vanilla planifolia]